MVHVSAVHHSCIAKELVLYCVNVLVVILLPGHNSFKRKITLDTHSDA